MATDGIQVYYPIIVMGVCYIIGKAINSTDKIPNWIIPPVLTVTGLLSGVAMAVVNGGNWKDAMLTALVGLLSGAGTVGIHQTYRQPACAMKAKKEAQAQADSQKSPDPEPPATVPEST